MSSHALDVFRQPIADDSITRIEHRTYLPYIKSFGKNDSIEITVNSKDKWIKMSDGSLIVRGKFVRTSVAGEIFLVNNAGAYFFDSITYELNGVEVDSVRDPGIVTTIKGFLCYSPNDEHNLATAGWTFPESPYFNAIDGSFSMRIPLKHLLGFFHDYNKALCGKHTLRLVRARNDSNCMFLREVGTTAQLTIDSVELNVAHLYPNDVIKLELLQNMKADRPILMPFRRWELHEIPALTAGSTEEIWSIKTCSALECPRFVIVAFHHERKDDATKDPNYFDNINISNIKLTLNGDYYPFERMRLNFAKTDFGEAHANYANFYSTFMQCSNRRPALLDYAMFKNRALFVIDCSRRDESMKASTVDIKLDIEARDGFPANTRAYCLIIHDVIIEHLPLSEIVRKLT